MIAPKTGPRRLRSCRKCGGLLTIFHACPELALADREEDLAQAVTEVEARTSEEEWAEIRERFPLTYSRIIEAIEQGKEA